MSSFADGFNSVISNWMIDENTDQIDATDMYFYFPNGSSYLHGEYKKRGTVLATVDLNHDGVTNYRFELSNGNYAIFTVDNHNPTGTHWDGCTIDYYLYMADDTLVNHGRTSYSTANLTYGEVAQWCDIYSHDGIGMITFAEWYTESFHEGDEAKYNFNYGFAMINQYCGEGIDYPIGVPDSGLESGVPPTFVNMSIDQCTDEADVENPSLQADKWLQWLNGSLDPKTTPSEEDSGQDMEQDGGFSGTIGYFTDSIVDDSLPSKSIANCGLCGIYEVTGTQLRQLAQFLWSSNFIDNIMKNMASPMENIISLGIVPFNGFSKTSSNIGIGNIDTGITASKLTQTNYILDCGSVSIGESYYGFGDYDPFTKYWIYLPYIGVVDLDSDDICRGGSVNVKYKFDVFSGACVAEIRCSDGVRGVWNTLHMYQGNILTTLPITGASYMNMYAQLASSMIGAAASIATENPIGLVNSAISALSAKPQYARSGSVSNVAGLLGIQKPFIIKATPQLVESKPVYKNTHGYVSNLKVNIGTAAGYLRGTINNTELNGITGATIDELEEIKELIGGGIYV